MKKFDMDFVEDPHLRKMLENAWQAITLTETWDLVKNEKCFMLCEDKRIFAISNKMAELGFSGHSGASFGSIMQYMKYLAEHGEDKFKEQFTCSRLATEEVTSSTTNNLG
jgi:hypothetical protein